MKYHDVIVNLITYILNQGREYLYHIDSGNAYDKIIRNYHQFNFRGDKVYRKVERMQKHYRFSESAWRKRKNLKLLYFEHLIPVKEVKLKLEALIDESNVVSSTNVKKILSITEIVVITREEASKVDKIYKTEQPNSGNDRLTELGINIEPLTQNNSLWS